MATNNKILVAVDKSAASVRAVRYVADIVGGEPGFHVGLIHLELPPRMIEWGGSEDPMIEDMISSERAKDYQDTEKEIIEGGQALLRKLQAILAEKQIDVIARVVQFAEPLDPKSIASDVLNKAKEREYGTVVVGRHSFSGLRRHFGHHVSEELVRTGLEVTVWVVE